MFSKVALTTLVLGVLYVNPLAVPVARAPEPGCEFPQSSYSISYHNLTFASFTPAVASGFVDRAFGINDLLSREPGDTPPPPQPTPDASEKAKKCLIEKVIKTPKKKLGIARREPGDTPPPPQPTSDVEKAKEGLIEKVITPIKKKLGMREPADPDLFMLQSRNELEAWVGREAFLALRGPARRTLVTPPSPTTGLNATRSFSRVSPCTGSEVNPSVTTTHPGTDRLAFQLMVNSFVPLKNRFTFPRT